VTDQPHPNDLSQQQKEELFEFLATIQPEKRFFRLESAANYLGISPAALCQWVERGEIHCCDWGSHQCFRLSDLDTFKARLSSVVALNTYKAGQS